MRVLIITYYWPPAGGPGVQRWLKFVKYLGEFDIEPVVFTVANPSYPIIDHSLQEEVPTDVEVLTQRIWEPNTLLNKGGQKKSAGFLEQKRSVLGSFMKYVRANFFIPDARKFWIAPSVKTLRDFLQKNPVEVVITTGPPHSVHLIGLELVKQLPLKWLADFRDPWTEIDYFHNLPLTKRSLIKHQRLEKQVVEKADAVVVVGNTMADSYKKLNQNTHVITNGYDDSKESKPASLDVKFSLVHIGMLNADRNHDILWKALGELCSENSEFKEDLELKFIGKTTEGVQQSAKLYKLESCCHYIDYVEHHEVLSYQQNAQLLLLLVNRVPSAKGIITGKIFEYLQARRPILAIAPEDGDLAAILNTTQAGICIDFSDMVTLKETILKWYHQFKSNTLAVDSTGIERYHRKNLTQELASILKQL